MSKFRKTHHDQSTPAIAERLKSIFTGKDSDSSIKRTSRIAIAAGAAAVLALGVGVTAVYGMQDQRGASSEGQTSKTDAQGASEASSTAAKAGSATADLAETTPKTNPGVPIAGEGQYVVLTVREIIEEELFGSTPGIFRYETFQPSDPQGEWISSKTSETDDSYDPYIISLPQSESSTVQFDFTVTSAALLAEVKSTFGGDAPTEFDTANVSLELKSMITDGGIPVAFMPTVVEALTLAQGNTVTQGVTSNDGSVGDSVSFSYPGDDGVMVKTHEIFFDPESKMPTGATFTWQNEGESGVFVEHIISTSVVDEAPAPNRDPETGQFLDGPPNQ